MAVIEGDSLFIDTHPENFACDAGTSECTVTTRRVYATPQEDGDGKTYTAYEARTVYACGSSAQLSLGGAQLDAAGQIVGEHQSDQADFEDVPMEYPGAAALYRAACDLTE
ncbi:MAG TPA: hypothetical protein VD962_13420 [Rubricoccaceae bacterium]|nr:hypothetical protein [Rubricoccaceae bacterium]